MRLVVLLRIVALFVGALLSNARIDIRQQMILMFAFQVITQELIKK